MSAAIFAAVARIAISHCAMVPYSRYSRTPAALLELRRFTGNRKQDIHIIIFVGLIPALFSTSCASVDDIIHGSRALQGGGFHEPSAPRGPVAGIHIDMFAPEATRAVIRLSAADDPRPAMLQ